MRIAIIGCGISGLTAALLLDHEYDVTCYEANAYLGGHTNTVPVKMAGQTHAVDTGFIVYNDRTYPHFVRLLAALEVPWQPSDMSFGLRCDETGLEYCGSSFNTLFAQRKNFWRPSFWRMLGDILRFNRAAPRLLDHPEENPTLGEFLQAGNYSTSFVKHYIIPMGAAIWSADPRACAAMPAKFFIRFFKQHGLLQIFDRPIWRVIQGGSAVYVHKLAARLRRAPRVNTPIERVERRDGTVLITPKDGVTEAFDQVIFATHSDQALRILGDATAAEREILAALPYQTNLAVLHTDEAVMPRARLAWASWNYHRLPNAAGPVAVTYWMNRLQSLTAAQNIFVTLNHTGIDEHKILRQIPYAHPVFTVAGQAAQARHAEISGVAFRTHYCGAYWRNGFHEDGVVSAIAVARALGIEID
jgi:predicted NAD/FAD-binding protein